MRKGQRGAGQQTEEFLVSYFHRCGFNIYDGLKSCLGRFAVASPATWTVQILPLRRGSTEDLVLKRWVVLNVDIPLRVSRH